MSKTRTQTRDYFNALLRDTQRKRIIRQKQIALLDCFAYDERELDAVRTAMRDTDTSDDTSANVVAFVCSSR